MNRSPSRRAVIGVLAAAPVATLPAVLPAASAEATHVPDPRSEATLITLGRELEEAERLRAAAYDRLAHAERQADYPLEPEVLIATNWDMGNALPMPTASHDVRGRTWTSAQIEEIRSHSPRREDTISARRRAEILAAYDARAAAVRAEDEALGLPALEGAYDAACERRDDIAVRIIETPAASLAGLQVKARTASVLCGRPPKVKVGDVSGNNALQSIFADLLAMGGIA